MTQHDVNTPIEVKPAPAKSSLETALIALDNRTSQVIHLSPSQAEAVLIDMAKTEDIIARLEDKVDALNELLGNS